MRTNPSWLVELALLGIARHDVICFPLTNIFILDSLIVLGMIKGELRKSMGNRDIHRRTIQFHNIPGDAHFLTCCCFQKRRFLARDRTREYVIDALDRARRQFNVDIWAYVIMPNHLHVLLFPREEVYDMGKIETFLKLSVSRRALGYLRKYNPEGLKHLATGQSDTPYRFWMQGSGYDENIASRAAARGIATYIHENPVRAGLCSAPEEWEWSSAREWMAEGSGSLSLDKDSIL